MRKKIEPGPVTVFVDNNIDEHRLFKNALKKVSPEMVIKSFLDGYDAYHYLKGTTDDIFMIVCDLHMPKLDGLELKRLIEMTPAIKIKSIPFFFHSDTSSETEIKAAYILSIQGFIKKNTHEVFVETLSDIVNIWSKRFIHPRLLRND